MNKTISKKDSKQTQKKIPQADDWNNYWSLDQTEKFTKISWSKRRIMTILQPYMEKNNTALDAGCGSGFFSKYFCDQGLQTVALDYSEQALEIADKMTLGKVKTVQADLLNSKITEEFRGYFDIIFSDGLLEHFPLEDQNKIIQNFKSMLSDEGVLVTFVPNKWSPWELIRPLFMPGIEETPFTLKELVELNNTNDLDILNQGGLNTLPIPYSPDFLVGSMWGMLLYTISKAK